MLSSPQRVKYCGTRKSGACENARVSMEQCHADSGKLGVCELSRKGRGVEDRVLKSC